MTPGVRRLVIAGLGLGAIAVAVSVLPVRTWALALLEGIRDAGALGVVVYGVAYVVAAVLMIPGSVLTLGAGFSYGLLGGSLLVIPASIAAAVIAFAIARRVGREWVARRIGDDRKFAAIDRAIGRAGFKITLLVRLSPVLPYGLLNYALGLTDVRFRDYVVASTVGMLPGTILYVYLGSLVTTATDVAAGPSGPWARALYWGGLAITIAVVVAITIVARRALRTELREAV